jgi:cell cycle checkpoint control protein RAD9A
MREKDTAIERCDISVEDGEGTGKSRFIVRIVCRHGMLSITKFGILLTCYKAF